MFEFREVKFGDESFAEMSFNFNIPLSAKSIARILGFYGDDGIPGEKIAEKMLCGEPRFSLSELEKISRAVNLSVADFINSDSRFNIYENAAARQSKRIAARLLRRGFDCETAADICRVPKECVKKLIEKE